MGGAELREINRECLPALKQVIRLIFYTTYPDKYFDTILDHPALSRVAYIGEIMVGCMLCIPDHDLSKIYIMAVGCLAPYRRRGIGTQLLQYIDHYCQNVSSIIKSIYLHVQVSNEDAITFYKRHGYRTTDRIKDYYKRPVLEDALVLLKSYEWLWFLLNA